MSEHFCPRLSEAIGSTILSLDQLLAILNFRILQLERFTHIYPIYGVKLEKILIIPQKTGGFST